MFTKKSLNKFFKLSLTLLTTLGGVSYSYAETENTSSPNIVIIYTDDLGIGDVSAYGMGKLSTPNIDSIAEQGIRFSNGYATAATCTPSRFSILTGQYPWRKGAAILPGDAPLLIDPSKITLPKMLKKAGYRTAVIGKWHLGLGSGQMDWNEHIPLGPNEVGFDYSYIMAATNDRVPNVYVKNGNVVGLEKNDPLQVSYQKNFPGEPTGIDNPELLTKMSFSNGHYHSINNGVPRIGYQKGGKSAQWIDEEMSDLFLNEAQNFVKANKSKPFFLFYTLHQPHVPRIPNQRFVGKSGLGPRGDAILEADWAIGEFLTTLEQTGLTDNTLVVFSSDNGPVLDDGYHDDAVTKLGKHTPAGNLRGGKYSLFDAGAHIPFMISWPGKIKPGVSDALVSQHDLLASLANLTGQQIAASDSQDHLDALLGKSKQGRQGLVVQALGGKTAYREGNWLFIPPYWGDEKLAKEDVETGYCSCYQLYDLNEDPGQMHNVAKEFPNETKAMLTAYRTVMASN
ncbi:arylsulfatase [Thalassotalea fonticola]|uniref:Arylsulfatase n=1 Tax=Thalassotalea fonticola TaxID=3065649 RepID=A0ABZ0GKF5_9GAMM|nr:arylsulfatase [Colwelliaceae bacterium S1-1]